MTRSTHEADIPRPEFPRPDFERSLWMSLNGEWEFDFDDGDRGEREGWGSSGHFQRAILVPFCYQSEASGIGDATAHEVVWYRRSFSLPESFRERRAILKFGAVDYEAKVWINGVFVGQHRGGNTPFSFDIAPYAREADNNLVLRALDRNDPAQPRGKQSWRGSNFGCWYTPTTGIWQSVWLEAVGSVAIDHFRSTPDVDGKSVRVEAVLDGLEPGLELEAAIGLRDRTRQTVSIGVSDRTPALTIDLAWPDELDGSFLWSPEQPNLFDLELSLKRSGREIDRVKGYFGMRKIEVKGDLVLLNNVPYFEKLVLDQGYWPASLLTPPSDAAIVGDINLAKSYGFNGVRKHQKIEDPRFYYWADRLGLLVWGEMPSSYSFTPDSIARVTREWQEFVNRDYNHPSIVTWVPINESWGVWNIRTDKRMQAFSKALYSLTKALDGTRLVSSNDGWEQVESDICAIHDYEASGDRFRRKIADKGRYLATYSDWRLLFAEGSKYSGEPLILSEYGGIAFKGGEAGQWGYRDAVENEKEFVVRFEGMTRAAMESGIFSGLCYTQLTDVQQEINGLAGPDRKPKFDPALIRAILER
jgi:beta-galactosidase/beta-glucuronidase